MATEERPVPLKERQELLRRVLASSEFARAESLRRILLFLFERAQDADGRSIREQEIAIEALGRPVDFDPRIDPIVRVSMASVRDRLRCYYEQEGRSEAVRLLLPKGTYKLQFEVRPEAPQRKREDIEARERFWAPYLSPTHPNLLVYTELLFYRSEDGTFVRNIYVNDRAAGESAIREYIDLPKDREWLPSFHFTSAGEVNCMLSIMRAFNELSTSLECRNGRFFTWADARRSNLILLGSSRTNPFVRSLLGGLPLTISPTAIEHTAGEGQGPVRYTGQRYVDGELERRIEYALVTRRAGPIAGTVVTIITGNHGRAIEGAGTFLSEESHVRSLDEAFGGAPPDHFQLLLRVEMLDYDEEVVDIAYVLHRPL